MTGGNGGERIASALAAEGVRFVFTLCGGHIAPILVGAKAIGLRVVDVRHEVDAVFAADAVFRMTGVPGVAAVTAGPGVTNTITAVKNAQLAQSAVVLFGGATGTLLKGRGALQDIDQMALIRPHVKWAAAARNVRELTRLVAEAFAAAREGVPGPVFLEVPVDLLYDEPLVREWYAGASKGKGLRAAGLRWYLERHLSGMFGGSGAEPPAPRPALRPTPLAPSAGAVRSAAERLLAAHRPVMVLGGQVLQSAPSESAAEVLRQAVENLGIPTYLASGARGLLGAGHPLQLKHKRKEALREADLVLLAGIPCDFRLDYGRQIGRGATFLSVNLNADDLKLNRRPSLAVHADPGRFVRDLAAALGAGAAGPIGALGAVGQARWVEWLRTLRARDQAREAEIDREGSLAGERVNPIRLCREIDRSLAEDSILVADGGDFVATASYTLSPRGPRTWLDPGVFGTLGVGGGFAIGAKLSRPEADVWILYGDGSSAFSLAEFDTFARHGLPIVAVVGNDASWNQIAREQVEILKDDVGTVLARTDYHVVAEGYGGKGILLRRNSEIAPALAEALRLSRGGAPVLVNAHLDKTEFRKGSISM